MNVRQLSMAACNDLVQTVSESYASSNRSEKRAILNEFTAVTGARRQPAVPKAGTLGR
jgi:hypothetical protein